MSMRFMILSVALVLAAGAAVAQGGDGHPITPIQFATGKSSATVSDSVERAANATYTFAAKAGQTAEVGIKSLEDNAVFVIFLPGATTTKGDGGIDVKGPTLPGIDADEGSTHWSGALPSDGTYFVTVAGTRGNATYELTVSIK